MSDHPDERPDTYLASHFQNPASQHGDHENQAHQQQQALDNDNSGDDDIEMIEQNERPDQFKHPEFLPQDFGASHSNAFANQQAHDQSQEPSFGLPPQQEVPSQFQQENQQEPAHSEANPVAPSISIENVPQEISNENAPQEQPYANDEDSKNHDENDQQYEHDQEEQDPNTSVTLNPPSSAPNFATPSKSLPPLKEIDPISTPKSFDVAKDADNVRSSPVATHAKSSNLADLAEANDVLENPANDTFTNIAGGHEHRNNSSYSSIDAESVASFLGVDASSLSTISLQIFQKLASAAQRFHGLQSELSFFKLNQEQLSQVESSKLSTYQDQISSLSDKNNHLTKENESLNAEVLKQNDIISNLRSENSTIQSQSYEQESKIKKLELEYSDLLQSKESETLRLNETLDKATRSNLDLGQKLSQLNKELSDAINEKFTYKLELGKATNELSYIKNLKEWYESELKALQDKYTSLLKNHDSEFLKTSNKVASLSSQNESLISLRDSLQAQISDLQSKLEKETSRATNLDSQAEVQKIKFSKELSTKDELIELLNVQIRERNERISQLELYAEDLNSSTSETIGNLQKDIVAKEDSIALLEEKLRRAEEALDAELHKETELPKLTSSAEIVMQNNPQGISLFTLYSEFNHMKKELVLERSQKEKLAAQLQHFVTELESRKPAITSYRNQILFYEEQVKDILGKLESLRIEKVESEKEASRLRSRLSSYETELQTVRQLSKDLGKQLCYYLIHSKVREGNQNPISASERKTIDSILAKSGNKDFQDESDTDRLVSERLVEFGSIVELQKRNEELLIAVRLLGKQLEEREVETNGVESTAVEEAREAILTLEGELNSLTVKLDAVTKERDLLSSISGSTHGASENSSVEVKLLSETISNLNAKLAEQEKSYRALQTESNERIKSLTDKISEVNNAREELQLKLNSSGHLAKLAESRLENTKKLLENSKKEVEHVTKEAAFWKEQASKQEDLIVKKSNELRDLERQLASSHSTAKNLNTEKQVWTALQESLKQEIAQLKADKDQLNTFVISLQNLFKEREQSSVELSNRLSVSIENYQNLQAKLLEKENKIEILSSQSEMALKAQNTKLEQVNELSQRLLESKQRLTEKQSLVDNLTQQLKTAQATRRPSRHNNPANEASSEGSVLAADYEDMKNDLRLAEAQVSEFSNIAKAAENALAKATESFDNYRSDAEKNLNSLQHERRALSEELSQAKTQINELQAQVHEAESRFGNEIQELRTKLHENSLKARSYDELKEEYEKKFSTINGDLESQIAVNAQTQQKFEQKLAEVEFLNNELVNQKEINDLAQQSIAELTQKVETASEEIKRKEDALLEEQRAKLDEFSSTTAKLKDLEYQYNIVLNQLELSNQGSPEPDGKEEEMREVVNYLRREKDIAEKKSISLAEEKELLRIQVEALTTESNALRSQVLKLQNTRLQLDDASAEHSRLLEQLEQLNIIRESNMTLRNENKRNLETIEQLQQEIEKLKNAPVDSAPTSAPDESTQSALQSQDLRLLKEENDRLKHQLSNNTELTTLMQRFENLKSEFKNKLIGHRNKNRELEKELADVRASLEEAKKSAEQANKPNTDTQALDDLKAKLASAETAKSDAENAKSEADKKLEEEVRKAKESLEQEKTLLKNSLRAEYEERLKEEISKAKPAESGPSEEEIQARVSRELALKTDSLRNELFAQFEKEMESKIQERVEEELKKRPAPAGDTEAVRKELTLKYEERIRQLNENIEKQLQEERNKVEQAVDKKYEFKLRVLNRKVERLESERKNTGGGPTSGGPAKNQAENTLTVKKPDAETPKTAASNTNIPASMPQQGENTSSGTPTDHPTTYHRKPNQWHAGDRKRPFNNGNQPSNVYKRPKD